MLPVEQELVNTVSARTLTTMVRVFRLCRPHQETAHRMPPLERMERVAHLMPVPNITELKFGQRHVAGVNMIENGRKF